MPLNNNNSSNFLIANSARIHLKKYSSGRSKVQYELDHKNILNMNGDLEWKKETHATVFIENK